MRSVFKKHPTFTHADDLKSICKPLIDHFGIDYFAYVQYDRTGRFSQIGLNPAFVEDYISQQYYHNDLHVKSVPQQEEHVLWDAQNYGGKTSEMHQSAIAHGLGHTFSVIQKTATGKDVFHFSGAMGNTRLNEFYVQNVDVLKSFILHFKDKLYSNKRLLKAFDFKFNSRQEQCQYDAADAQLPAPQKAAFLKALKIKRYFHQGCLNHGYFTARELQCMYWFSQGKTAIEVGLILSITDRMIKEHVKNIKEKLGCRNLFQIGQAFSAIQPYLNEETYR